MSFYETFEQWRDRAQRTCPARHRRGLDTTEVDALDPSIKQHFGTTRVEVTSTYESGETYIRRGRIAPTTGWRPALILMARSNSTSSGDVLRPGDKVTAVIAR